MNPETTTQGRLPERPSVTPGPISFTRRLSVDGDPLVSPGQWVDADTPLLAMHTFPGRVLRNQVSGELRIGPTDTEDALTAKPGQMVKTGDIVARSSMFWQHRIARTRYEGSIAGVSPSLGVIYMREHIPTQIAETVRISIADDLKGDKNLFSSYVKVKDGQKVEKGQLVASRQDGHTYHNIFSPVFGTVANVAPLLGALSIIPDRVSSVVTAHIPGRVVTIRDSREVDLVGNGVVFEGLIGIGGEAFGELTVAPNSAGPWRPQADATLRGRVVLTGHIDETSLRQAAELGVAAVIAGRADESALCRYAGKELGVIATGDEDIPLVVILTEGFGTGGANPRTFELLSSLGGHLTSVTGTTHIRAGVIRPRIVVSVPPADACWPGSTGQPVGQSPGGHNLPARVGLLETSTELATGLRARVLRGPSAGRSGTILDLPAVVRRIATGASVLVALVELDPLPGTPLDGPLTVTVAQANLKLEGGGTPDA